jgi:hypothetical protein
MNLNIEEVMMSAFSLNIQNHIDEIVAKRTEPAVTKVMDTLKKVSRLEVNVRTL